MVCRKSFATGELRRERHFRAESGPKRARNNFLCFDGGAAVADVGAGSGDAFDDGGGEAVVGPVVFRKGRWGDE